MNTSVCTILIAAVVTAAPGSSRDKRGFSSGHELDLSHSALHHTEHEDLSIGHELDQGFGYETGPSLGADFTGDHSHSFGHEPAHDHSLSVPTLTLRSKIVSVNKLVETPKVVHIKKVVSIPKVVSVPEIVKVSKIVQEPHLSYSPAAASSSGWW